MVTGKRSPQFMAAPSLNTQITQRIEEMIIAGELLPGEHLLETELAKLLGVSRSPVRVAIAALSDAGMVDVLPRRGAFVHKPTEREIDDFFHVRALLETDAIKLVANAGPNPETAAVMSELLHGAEEVLAAGSLADAMAFNDVFHEQLAKLSNNTLIMELMARMARKLRWYSTPTIRARSLAACGEHRDILVALLSGSVEDSLAAAESHANARRKYLDQNRDPQAYPPSAWVGAR